MAHTDKHSKQYNLNKFREDNFFLTMDLAREAASANVKRFIYISSVKVNGDSTDENHQFSPSNKYNPSDYYSISKSEAEVALIKLAKKTNMEFVIIRLPLVYGPNVKANFLSMMKFVYKYIYIPFGNIKNKRSLIFVLNAVDLIIKTINHRKAANEIFLASDDDDVSTTTLLNLIAYYFGKKIKMIPLPIFVLNLLFFITGKKDLSVKLLRSLSIDISKTKKLLAWSPPYTLEEGVEATCRHFLKDIKK
jgi:UDP-glucose 4-epimerase